MASKLFLGVCILIGVWIAFVDSHGAMTVPTSRGRQAGKAAYQEEAPCVCPGNVCQEVRIDLFVFSCHIETYY